MTKTRIALLLALAIPTTSVEAREGPIEPPPRGGQAIPEPPPVRTLPTFTAFVCIHGHEAAWNANTGNGYHGGLQMDWSFMRAYGRSMLQKYGGRGAEAWTPAEQIRVAHRAWLTRGFGPWPQTRLMCGV